MVLEVGHDYGEIRGKLWNFLVPHHPNRHWGGQVHYKLVSKFYFVCFGCNFLIRASFYKHIRSLEKCLQYFFFKLWRQSVLRYTMFSWILIT